MQHLCVTSSQPSHAAHAARTHAHTARMHLLEEVTPPVVAEHPFRIERETVAVINATRQERNESTTVYVTPRGVLAVPGSVQIQGFLG